MKCATGGGCGDAASMKRLHDTYICSEYHYVSNDAEPHADVCANIKAAGMVPIYDIEMAIWATTGFNVNLDIGYLRPKLQAIKDVGWAGFSSEGVSQKQVSVLREYLPYINYGGERGEDVYAGNMYYRPRDMADGNYLEAYYKESAGAYHNALISANSSTPDNMGLTLMLYSNASLEMDSGAMLSFVDTAIKNGVKINKILFWCGVVHCPTDKLDSEFNFLWNAFNGRYGFTLDDVAPPEPVESKPVDSFNVYLQKVEPGHVRIIFYSAAADGTPANNDPVILNDLWPDRVPKRLAAGYTGGNGGGWASFDLTLPKKKYLFEIVSGDVRAETSWIDLA